MTPYVLKARRDTMLQRCCRSLDLNSMQIFWRYAGRFEIKVGDYVLVFPDHHNDEPNGVSVCDAEVTRRGQVVFNGTVSLVTEDDDDFVVPSPLEQLALEGGQ